MTWRKSRFRWAKVGRRGGDTGRSHHHSNQKTAPQQGGEQSSTLEFAPGTFSGLTPASFENSISSGVQVGDEVAVIDWDGVNPGSTEVVWANVKSISTYDGVPSLQVDINVHQGASGGGVFFNGVHIANNTNTGLYGSYSWAAINQ